MTGDHRGATAGARGSWPVAIVASVGALIAVVGLLVYELEFATLLENYACVAGTWLASFVLMAMWRRRSTNALLWVSAGPLVLASWQLISTLADEHRWQERHHVIPLAGSFIFAGAMACMATGAVIGIRSGDVPLPRAARKLVGVRQKDPPPPEHRGADHGQGNLGPSRARFVAHGPGPTCRRRS
jgi:hypothetical protein